ncbi:uncharacterized protein LACBIDRAFT_303453 [Laccaria bicolor S238N-H82]|uniref:Predicted protein n=1 Tax=Laccaria bicolor (strain S238N-H82 / ATCC MYA-4686) TaxID=486041 RepID=B0DJI1_LACBS|nr:uncharacterized protein LACBIDRAFT_303453 [Laccaria bicolor S238N-H82]EDR05212.1 predicted protein [Laccaria bicolor S238N-H82]|eukprot:XP_001884177.1 predicted protein [Laccaria bicolor S238N-H82]
MELTAFRLVASTKGRHSVHVKVAGDLYQTSSAFPGLPNLPAVVQDPRTNPPKRVTSVTSLY